MSNLYTDTNEPAFPTQIGVEKGTLEGGMTMREWYAGMALQMASVFLVNPLATEAEINAVIAARAFGIADAMIAQSAKPPKEKTDGS